MERFTLELCLHLKTVIYAASVSKHVSLHFNDWQKLIKITNIAL